MDGNVTVRRENGRYVIREPAFESGKELTAGQAYYVTVNGSILLCFDDFDRNYFRIGPRESDINDAVFDVKQQNKEAMLLLKEKALSFARNLAERRRYQVDDQTE